MKDLINNMKFKNKESEEIIEKLLNVNEKYCFYQDSVDLSEEFSFTKSSDKEYIEDVVKEDFFEKLIIKHIECLEDARKYELHECEGNLSDEYYEVDKDSKEIGGLLKILEK